MVAHTNSRQSRVDPVFGWLRHQGTDWPTRLLAMAEGLQPIVCGPVQRVVFEAPVQPSSERLAWMILNGTSLQARRGRHHELRARLADEGRCRAALRELGSGGTKIGDLKLEGRSYADCLIECERAFIWIEGKRTDWLAASTTYDADRDQLARNVEAVWSTASKRAKDYCVLVCHESPLSEREKALISGYRNCSLVGGLPHLSAEQRSEFSTRIGTLTWQRIAAEWPALRAHDRLFDLPRSEVEAAPGRRQPDAA